MNKGSKTHNKGTIEKREGEEYYIASNVACMEITQIDKQKVEFQSVPERYKMPNYSVRCSPVPLNFKVVTHIQVAFFIIIYKLNQEKEKKKKSYLTKKNK